MSSQVLSAVMEESCNFMMVGGLFLGVMQLWKYSQQCSRRKQTTTSPTARRNERVPAAGGKRRSYANCDTDKSTEAGDASNNEFSDRSTDYSSSVRGNPARPGQQRFNADAACFVPSTQASQGFSAEFPQNPQQLRQSIRMLKGALEDWESNLPAQAAPQPDNLAALQQALDKLTPQEAATVRSILDSKVAPQPAGLHPSARMPERMEAARAAPQAYRPRPFTPFQGARSAPWEQARPAKTQPKAEVPESSLSTQLRDLAALDSECVVMVRKINRLGLDSAGPLEEYFSQFGKVVRVMVAPTLSKSRPGEQARVRPAPLGFVVMSTADDVQKVLGFGVEHVVSGECIGAYPFQSHTI